MTTLQELESDPKFKKLSYSDQIYVRSNWAAKTLPSNPDFQLLSPQDKQAASNQILYRPPVTEDPYYSKRAETMTKRLQTGDASAQSFMLTKSAATSFADQSLIAKALGFLGSSMDGAHGLGDEISNKDALKETAYYDYLLSQDKKIATGARILKTVAGFIGMGIDMAVGYGALAGSVKAPKLLAKVAQETILKRMTIAPFSQTKNLVRFGQAVKNAVPNITHAVAGGGMVGAVREPLMKFLDGAITGENPSLQELLLTSAKGAGSYAAGDLLFFTLGRPLVLMGKQLKNTFSKGKLPGVAGLTMDEKILIMQDASSGKQFDQALLDRLDQIDPSKELRRTVLDAQDKLTLGRKLDEKAVGSDEHKQAMAAIRGWSLNKVKDPATGQMRWEATGLWRPDIKFTVGGDDAAGHFVYKEALNPQQPLTGAYSLEFQAQYKAARDKLVGGRLGFEETVEAVRPEVYGSPGARRASNKKLTPEQQLIQNFMFNNVAYIPTTISQGGGRSLNRMRSPEMHARAYFARSAQLASRASSFEGSFSLFKKANKPLLYEDFVVAAEDLTRRGFFGPMSYAKDSTGKTLTYATETLNSDMWWKFAPEGDILRRYSNYARPFSTNGAYDEAFVSWAGHESLDPLSVRYYGTLESPETAQAIAEGAVAKQNVPFSLRWAVTRDEAEYLATYTTGGKPQFQKGFVIVVSPSERESIQKGFSPVTQDKLVKFVPAGFPEYERIMIDRGKPGGIGLNNEVEAIANIPTSTIDLDPIMQKLEQETSLLKPEQGPLHIANGLSSSRQSALAMGADAFTDGQGNYYFFRGRQDIKMVSDVVTPTELIESITRAPTSADELALKAANDNLQTLALQVTGIIGSDKRSQAIAIAQLLSPRNGVTSSRNLELATRLLGERLGLKRGDLPIEIASEAVFTTNLNTMEKGTDAAAWWDYGTKKIYVYAAHPESGKVFADPITQRRMTQTYLHEMTHAIQDYAAANNIPLKLGKIFQRKALDSANPMFQGGPISKTELQAELVSEKYTAELMRYAVGSPGWLEWAASQQKAILRKTEKGWELVRSGQKEATIFKSQDDLLENILLHDQDPTMIVTSLKEQGSTLRIMPEAEFNKALAAGESPMRYKVYTYMGKNPRLLAEGNDLEPILQEVGWKPKMSSYLGPELAVIDDAVTGKVTYSAGVASGGYLDLLHHFKSFQSSRAVAAKRLRVNKDGIISFLPGAETSYSVTVNGLDDVRYFSTTQEAVEYLDGGWKQLHELQKTARNKGYDLKMSPAGYHLWNGDDGSSIIAKDLADLTEQLNKVPKVSFAPEVIGEYRGIEPLTYVEGTFKPSYFDVTGGRKNLLDPLVEISHWARPRDAYLVSALNAGKISPELLSSFRTVQLARRTSNGEMHSNSQALVTLLSEEGRPGKLIPIERRRLLTQYLDNQATLKQVEAIKAQLTPHELRVAEGMREWFDGLFSKFGIEDKKFVMNYISHIRQEWLGNKKKLSGTLGEILHRSGAPKKLSMFFENFRNEDIPNFLMEDDIFQVAMSYSAVGHRAQFLNPALKQLDDSMKLALKDPNTSKNAVWALAQYKDQVLGMHTANEEAVMKALVSFGEKMGLKDPSHMRDMYNAIYSVSYLAMMGWRPYSAARNLMQVWQTLAPRFGNGNTVKGLEYFNKNAQYVHEQLKKTGHITEYMPVYGSETMDITGKFGKLVHKGLSWFKNADDITRGIAYSTAKVQWDDAIKNFNAMISAGKSKDAATHAFMEISGLNLVAPDVRATAGRYMRGEIGNPKGSFEAAFDVFSAEVIETTMFAYQAGLSPTAYRGVVGKMFGMFGVYPAWYLENIRRGFSYGTTGQKMMFAARLMGNSAAFFGAFTAVGINAKDFLPWTPVQFTGGPYYKIANQLLSSIGSDYQARQSRAELKKSIPRAFIPGSQMFENLNKAIQAADEGDPWGVWLHLISAPESPGR